MVCCGVGQLVSVIDIGMVVGIDQDMIICVCKCVDCIKIGLIVGGEYDCVFGFEEGFEFLFQSGVIVVSFICLLIVCGC